MTDPAEIITGILLNSTPRTGTALAAGSGTENGLAWQYHMMMGNPAAPELARCIAEAVLQALADAGYTLVPPPAPAAAQPSPGQIRAWLTCHEWKPGDASRAGALWFPPVRGRGVIVPHEGGTPGEIGGVIERVADRMSMTPGQVTAEMMLYAGD